MFKNTASQKLTVIAFADAGHASLDAGEVVTGDAANISMKVEQDDDGTRTASNDASPTETEDGQYVFDLTQAETNGNKLTFYPESSTAGVQVVALPSNVIYTNPPNFQTLSIESDGDLTKVNTLDGHTAQTGDSFTRIGTNGASLTAVPWNSAWDAEVQSEVNDGLIAFWTSPATLVDLVWDELLTGATHNIATSAGRRIRQISAVPMYEGTIDDASPTSTSFATTLTGLGDSVLSDALLMVEYASDQWEARPIVSYTSATGTFTFDEAFSSTLSDGDNIAVQVTHIHPLSKIREEIDTNSTQLASIKTDTGNLVTRITSSLFSGITSLASWLGLIAGKTADASTLAEINSTTAGAAYDNTTDSLENIKDTGGGDATAANQSTLLNRLGAITGSGDNTLLGYFKALLSKTGATPSDIGGTFAPTTDSTEAIRDKVDTLTSSTGSGARTVTVTVNDGTTALENATVRFTEGANTYVGSTNVSGQVTFNLDDATYTVAVTKSGYSYAGTTVVISGDATPTYSMTANSFTVSDAGFITGLIKAHDETGSVVGESEATFYLEILSGDGTAGWSWDNKNRSAATNASGIAEFTNIPYGSTFYFWRGGSQEKKIKVTAPTSGASFNIDEVVGAD